MITYNNEQEKALLPLKPLRQRSACALLLSECSQTRAWRAPVVCGFLPLTLLCSAGRWVGVVWCRSDPDLNSLTAVTATHSYSGACGTREAALDPETVEEREDGGDERHCADKSNAFDVVELHKIIACMRIRLCSKCVS